MTTATPATDRGDLPTRGRRNRAFLVAGLFVAFVLAGFVSGFASSAPDGLEKVAEEEGFLGSAEDHAFAGFPIADYAVSGIGNERLAGGLAGVIGVVTTFVVGGALVLAVVRLRPGARRPGSAGAAPDQLPTPASPPAGR